MSTTCGSNGTVPGLNEARLEALLTLSQMTESPLQAITDFALEQAVLLTGSKLGYLAFVSEDETVLTMHSWSRSAMKECEVAGTPRVYPLETTGLWGEAVRQRRPVVTNDYARENPLKRGLPEGHVALTRHMNVPVFDGPRIVIVAGVGNKEDGYDDSDVRQLTLLMDGTWKLLKSQRTAAELRQYRMQLEQLVDQRTAELTLANEELHQERQHLRDLLELYDRDRRLIGFEIHDGLTQLVTGAVMQWETAVGNLKAGGEEVPPAAGTGLSLARQALDESRRLIAGLHSDVLEQEGVVAAICDLIRRLAAYGHGPRIEFHHHLGADRFPGPLENTMYRIVQETVNNACRHSQSDRVRIELNQEGDRVRIEVEDWGKGFDLQSVGTGHYGLESISQRARLFGGDALIESHPGHGTRIVAQLPLLL